MTEELQVIQLLREIRDQQREALALQREHLGMVQQQLARAERINDRAEAIQGRAFRAVKLIALVAVPLLFVLLGLMFVPYLSRLF